MADEYRVYNFSAGPSVLPEPVLRKCAAEMLDYEGTGESVMEMSHRSPEYQKIIDDAEANLRKLMNIPDDYYVLFLQGGGTLQFSMVPINLMTGSKKADYIVAGQWGKKAWEEARKFGDARCVASSEDAVYTYIPKVSKEDIRDDVDYVYICYNNTVFGTHYNEIPDFGDHLLVADMSSCILSEEIDVTKFGLIYAGAQKNVAPAGVTIVIVRKDLVGKAPENTPIYLNYKTHAEKGSMYNTPPCYSIYVAGEVFKYLLANGGVKAMHEKDVRKAQKLYDYLDNNPECMTAPVDYTNDIYSIAALDNFMSINNAVDIDLYGQISSETSGTKQISRAKRPAGTASEPNIYRHPVVTVHWAAGVMAAIPFPISSTNGWIWSPRMKKLTKYTTN